MLLLDGKIIAKAEKEKIKSDIEKTGLKACLSVILVGNDPSSQIYVNSKEKACLEMGLQSKVFRLPSNTPEDEIISRIRELNADPVVNGILVQIPLPKHYNEERILDSVDPLKDVDCLHPYNFGKLYAGNSFVEPCTPSGIVKILDFYKIDLTGKKAVVIGRSNIVGKPIAALLMHRNATVTICHSKTRDLPEEIRRADIVVAAIGKPEYVQADWIKEGAVVIDVGINRVEDSTKEKGYRVVGDVDFSPVSKKAFAITPVPGGVGALTIINLLNNTIKLARIQQDRS